MTRAWPQTFDSVAYLAGVDRQTVRFAAKERLFSQGDPADSVFYLQMGRVKITVVYLIGNEASISLLGPRAFVG